MSEETRPQEEELVPLREAAARIGASPNRLLTWERRGLVMPIRDRRRRRYYLSADVAKLARWHSWQQRKIRILVVIPGDSSDPDLVRDLSQEEARLLMSLGFYVAAGDGFAAELGKRHRSALQALRMALQVTAEEALKAPLVPKAVVEWKAAVEAFTSDQDVAALAGTMLGFSDEQVRAVLSALADDPRREEVETVFAEFLEFCRLEDESAKAEHARRAQAKVASGLNR